MNTKVASNRWFIWTIVIVVVIGISTWSFVEYVTIEMEQNAFAISYSQTRVKFSVEVGKVCNGMTFSEAEKLAIASECGNRLKEPYICNQNTKTWWLGLDVGKVGCFPACVVNTLTKETEISWRCVNLEQ